VDDIGSDHFGITFTIKGSRIGLADPQTTRFDTKRADWAKFGEKLFCQLSPLQNELQAYSYILSSNPSLKSLEQINAKRSYEATLDRLDNMAERYTSAILSAAHDAIPQIRLAPHAKPWWNDSLKTL